MLTFTSLNLLLGGLFVSLIHSCPDLCDCDAAALYAFSLPPSSFPPQASV